MKTSTVIMISGLREFAVWISDPLENKRDVNPYIAQETFVFLTEAFWDLGEFQTVYSGCSALKAIVNTFEGKQFLERGEDWVVSHPIEKLRELGGTVSDERQITSLYLPKYMSDEMFLGGIRGKGQRCYDLLGYLVFITESLTPRKKVV